MQIIQQQSQTPAGSSLLQSIGGQGVRGSLMLNIAIVLFTFGGESVGISYVFKQFLNK
jgi:hypothetical protein